MCGIAGVWRFGGASAAALEGEAAAMTERLRHRGPDDGGVWVDAAAGVALGNRRLAIVDLSPGGHQPMLSADGRVTVAFNGEIYNHPALRRELEREGVRFRSRSDTEVLVEAIARWGLDTALERADGMFGLAVWQPERRCLTLARDRLGEKPLYWAAGPGLLLFGSELKALRAHPDFARLAGPLDAAALSRYLRLSCIPAPLTIHSGVRQLRPGCLLEVGPDGMPAERRYWSAEAVARQGLTDPLPADDPEAATDALHRVLAESVAARMEADVPLGVFLSGGVDSSLVAALMREHASRPVISFSIGFAERSHDESVAAAAVARHLGTEHVPLTVTARDALDLVPALPSIYDEPFADSSQLPTLLLSRLARRQVTVALTGDGGDEVFAGYERHIWAERLERLRARLPGPAGRLAGAALLGLPPAVWDGVIGPLVGRRRLAERVRKLAAALQAGTMADLHDSLLARWPDPAALLAAAPPVAAVSWALPGAPAAAPDLPPVARMQLADALGYLPDGVLVKVDRASMAASLEARAPFLAPAVVAFGWRLPPTLRVAGAQGKVLPRRLLRRYLPAALVDAPKSGFTVPIGDWLRGPLRDWAEPLLAPPVLEAAGLRPEPVLAVWRQHLDGAAGHGEALWTVLTYVAWTRAGAA